MSDPISIPEIERQSARILAAVEGAVIGKRDRLELVLLGILCDGHVLIEDLPGLAKTLMAESFARATGTTFRRIQFTPDLMPSDVTGAFIYNQQRAEFDFREGPVFANVLLADEINRAPPKTQSALLEAMQERQVTVEGVTRELPRPFMVIATQNPIEFEGTYPLPEAQLDRFLLRLEVGYPSEGDEAAILAHRSERATDAFDVPAVVDTETLRAMQAGIEHVHVAESITRYVVALVRATRASPRLQVGASPRGSLALLKLSRARAAIEGRDFVLPDDVKAVAVPALAHRLILRPELWVQRVKAEAVVEECLAAVAAPSAEEPTRPG
ncbi:MAG TPA: MoxR family ATPase [Candidatus Limnocylindrales bacterium]|nr:MoxR family ATPase [Candidatus Limnocylindrales bacterium]